MSQSFRILGMAGSLRRQSFNRAALRAAGELLPADTVLDIYELGEFPLFNQDLEQTPPPVVAEFKKHIRAADAILFVTPEYNYSISGVLKNAIDWGSRPYGDNSWEGKVAAMMGASGGAFGTARAQYHLRQMMVWLDMHPVNRPEVMIGNSAQKFDENGNLTDDRTKELIRQLLSNLVAWKQRLG